MDVCKTCEFLEPTEPGKGNCHFNPPVPMIMGVIQTIRGPQPQVGAVWPVVDLEKSWCSQHLKSLAKGV